MAKKQTFSTPVIILIVVIVIGAIAFFAYKNTNVTGNVLANFENCREEQVAYEEQEEYMKTEYYMETVPYTDRECEDKSLVYKVVKGECKNQYDGWFENTPASYSCTITNLDSEAGTFSMRIGFNVQGQQLDETQSKLIYPQSSETFTVTRDSKIDNCYCVETVPTKKVCRDVTKYRDEQRERQVTAYRPVTKYKAEKICD